MFVRLSDSDINVAPCNDILPCQLSWKICTYHQRPIKANVFLKSLDSLGLDKMFIIWMISENNNKKGNIN